MAPAVYPPLHGKAPASGDSCGPDESGFGMFVKAGGQQPLTKKFPEPLTRSNSTLLAAFEGPLVCSRPWP